MATKASFHYGYSVGGWIFVIFWDLMLIALTWAWFSDAVTETFGPGASVVFLAVMWIVAVPLTYSGLRDPMVDIYFEGDGTMTLVETWLGRRHSETFSVSSIEPPVLLAKNIADEPRHYLGTIVIPSGRTVTIFRRDDFAMAEDERFRFLAAMEAQKSSAHPLPRG